MSKVEGIPLQIPLMEWVSPSNCVFVYVMMVRPLTIKELPVASPLFCTKTLVDNKTWKIPGLGMGSGLRVSQN